MGHKVQRSSVLEKTPDKKCKEAANISKVGRKNSGRTAVHRHTQSNNEAILKKPTHTSFTKAPLKSNGVCNEGGKLKGAKTGKCSSVAKPIKSSRDISAKKLSSPNKSQSAKNVVSMEKIVEERKCTHASEKRIGLAAANRTLNKPLKTSSATPRDKHNLKFQKQNLNCNIRKSESTSNKPIHKKIISPTNKNPNSFSALKDYKEVSKAGGSNKPKRVRSEKAARRQGTEVTPAERLRMAKDSKEISSYIASYIKLNNKIPPTSINFYRIGRVLGKGAFGKVNLGIHKLTGKLVAIKSIKKTHLSNKTSREKVMKEFSILKALRHQNIIRLYESFETDKHILIVMELCAGGDVLSYIKRHRKVKEEVAKRILKELVTGLGYCHSRGVLHRDIKLENILFNHVGELKICDFGVSRSIARGERIMERCGTPAYIAPEIVKGEGYQDFAADIWSAGVVLYSILYGTLPFKANNINDLNRLILRGKYKVKEDLSDNAKDLVKRMLKRNPGKRITIPEILGHKWMSSTSDKTDIFTEEEVICLDKEYWDGCKSSAGNETLNEVNISSAQSDIENNSLDKSVILGPFNSNQTDALEVPESMICSKESIIRFSMKVRDVDRQYEKNNNGDVDNGVYTKFLVNSNEDDLNKKESFNTESMSEDSIDTTGRLSKAKVPSFINKPMKIDEKALVRIEKLGYPREYVKKCIHGNELNHATATYYLMTNNYS
eukprot:TRINITY_DN2093_c0_g1_i1.p1 TRINITY_DN2093_c0_g1~~TRINITY_DN2093_c0_g1_i1.p1  ORF type:complete len:720 (-),score=227.83 TRINITY_DN2093_c0_g1_i1:141-2300(-)